MITIYDEDVNQATILILQLLMQMDKPFSFELW
jgi:hypothetical protein